MERIGVSQTTEQRLQKLEMLMTLWYKQFNLEAGETIKEALNKTVNGLNNLSTHLQQIEQRLIALEESKIEEIEKIRALRIQLENQLKKF